MQLTRYMRFFRQWEMNSTEWKIILQNIYKQINEIENKSTNEKLTKVQLIDDLSNYICMAADLTDCLRNMHPDDKLKKAAEERMRAFTEVVEILNTRPQLYSALKNSLHSEASRLDEISIRVAKLFLQDFELSGEISLKRLISARHEIAQLTNFPTFAHRAQINSILCDYNNVHKFLENIIEGFSGQIDSELEQILQLTTDYSSHKPLEIERQLGYSDLEFASSIRRSQLIEAIDGNQSISRFFHFGAILDGFELIVQKLYGISFKRLLPEKGECWEGNVIKLKVYRDDENNQTFLGDIFIDVDARPSKLQGDCHFTIRCSKLLENGQFQTPIVVVSLAINHTGSNHFQSSTCSLSNLLEKLEMSHQQAENFFHEMGHAMHSILGRTIFQHVAGTRCPTDFAEVPSHLMECFFNDSKILQKICRDVSGRFMDSEQASTLIKCRRIFPAIHNTQQAIFSLLDLEIHGEHAADISQNKLCTTDLFLQLHKKALPQLDIPKNYAYHHRISHLVTYGAKYYSYLLARASASMIYESLFNTDLLERENGQKWAEVQSFGGEYPSDVLLAKALGTTSAPSSEQLTQALIKDATNKLKRMKLTAPLRYMRFFKRRETISMDMNPTEWKMIKDSGKRAFWLVGSAFPALILCLPSVDVFFDLMFYKHERFRAFVEQYSSDNASTNQTFKFANFIIIFFLIFSNEIRRFKYVRKHTKSIIENRENITSIKE